MVSVKLLILTEKVVNLFDRIQVLLEHGIWNSLGDNGRQRTKHSVCQWHPRRSGPAGDAVALCGDVG